MGYTNRVDPTNSGLSGVTGSLTYQHMVSAKTTVNLGVNRTLQSYITTGGNEIDTTASTAVSYQATYKIGIRAGYAYTDSKYPNSVVGDGLTADPHRSFPDGHARSDVSGASLAVNPPVWTLPEPPLELPPQYVQQQRRRHRTRGENRPGPTAEMKAGKDEAILMVYKIPPGRCRPSCWECTESHVEHREIAGLRIGARAPYDA